MIRPSFLNLWWGSEKFEFKSDDGQVLRVENQRETEASFLFGVARATWTTIIIGTLGSTFAALLALPFGFFAAKNLKFSSWLSSGALGVLNFARSIHTLIFGLFFVGITGLGPMAGILAICAHSFGSYGKLYAEAIEALDMLAVDGVRAVGASPAQVFFYGVWPSVLPQFISIHLYLLEFNIRDSTMLGLIGAGGLGLLISESISLFQWSRLSTILLVIVLLVTLFNWISQRMRAFLL